MYQCWFCSCDKCIIVIYYGKNLAGAWSIVGAQRNVCWRRKWHPITFYDMVLSFVFLIFSHSHYLCPQLVVSLTLITDAKSPILHTTTAITIFIFLEHWSSSNSYPQELHIARPLRVFWDLAPPPYLPSFPSQDMERQSLCSVWVPPALLLQVSPPRLHWPPMQCLI